MYIWRGQRLGVCGRGGTTSDPARNSPGRGRRHTVPHPTRHVLQAACTSVLGCRVPRDGRGPGHGGRGAARRGRAREDYGVQSNYYRGTRNSQHLCVLQTSINNYIIEIDEHTNINTCVILITRLPSATVTRAQLPAALASAMNGDVWALTHSSAQWPATRAMSGDACALKISSISPRALN